MWIYWMVLLAILATGCRKQADLSNLDSGFGLELEERHLKRSAKSCSNDSMRCARVQIGFPWVTKGPEQAINTINETIIHQIKSNLAVFDPKVVTPEQLDSAAGQFILEYEDLLQRQPGYNIPWTVTSSGKVLFQSAKVLSVELSNYSYTGGAHPNSYLTLLNFDAQTGETLHWEDVVSDLTELKQRAEVQFRIARQLDPEEDLSKAGYFWEGSFRLPENFALTRAGILFYFNPYEIASYAEGPIIFTLSYDQLDGILIAERIF